MAIVKIVSGGQTGADRGGLDAAIYCGLPCGGWIPKDRLSEGGRIPAKYEELSELDSADYLNRTHANVVDSDATLIFSHGALEGGSLETAQLAGRHNRPCLHVDPKKLGREACVEAIVKWISTECPPEFVLNVAGSRASKAPGIQQQVTACMIDVISRVNRLLLYPLPEERIVHHNKLTAT
jgi:hypothetical protein